MELDEFITATEIAFERLMTPTKGLRAEQFEEPLAAGKWSFKELAAHFSYWNALVIHKLEAIHQGRDFDGTSFAGNFDGQNALAAARVKDQPVKRVLSEFRLTHSTLMEAVKRVEPDKLSPDSQIPQWIIECVTEHYHHHRPQVEAWVMQLQASGKGPLTQLPTREA